MKKLMVAQSKGGAGKSTVAVNLAYALVTAGMKVDLLDLDFAQGTASTWIQTAAKRNAEAASITLGTPTPETTLQIIDTEGKSAFEDYMRTNPPVADLYLIPVQPNSLEAPIAAKTAAIIHKYRPDASIRLVFNQVEVGTVASQMLDDIVASCGVERLAGAVHRRMAYQYAAAKGFSGFSAKERDEWRGLALQIVALLFSTKSNAA